MANKMFFKRSSRKWIETRKPWLFLLKGLQVKGETRKIWERACGIVNKDPELAEISLDRTEEAVKCHHDSDVINEHRGESFMKNGRFAEATDYFNRLSDRGQRASTAA